MQNAGVREGRTQPIKPGSLSAPSGRLRSLDGLRGIAAAVVLVHHGLLTVPSLAAAYSPAEMPAPTSGPAFWLSFTPLHLFWAGTEAVYLFFVLSGLVLVLPVLAAKRFDWFGYFPRRLVRLYGPVAAAVVLGLILVLLVPRYDGAGLGVWVNGRPNSYSPYQVLQDLYLLSGASDVVSPLWSLQWELIFSLALPLVVLFIDMGRRFLGLKLLLIAVSTTLGTLWGNGAFWYLPLFAIGALLASEWGRLGQFFGRLGRRAWFWPVVLVAAVLLTTSAWWLVGVGLQGVVVASPVGAAVLSVVQRWAAVAGVTLLILAAAFWRPARASLELRPAQWLGKVSFSLYLVHEPIILAVRFATAPLGFPSWAGLLISLPLALGVAQLFSMFVELPFHRLSREVGRRVAAASLPGHATPAPAGAVAHAEKAPQAA